MSAFRISAPRRWAASSILSKQPSSQFLQVHCCDWKSRTSRIDRLIICNVWRVINLEFPYMPHNSRASSWVFRSLIGVWKQLHHFTVSDISCFVDDFTQPIKWFHVGPIKSSLLLHLILVAVTPLSRALVYTLRHDAWYFVSQQNRPKPLICVNIFKSNPLFSTVIFTPPSRLKTRTR